MKSFKCNRERNASLLFMRKVLHGLRLEREADWLCTCCTHSSAGPTQWSQTGHRYWVEAIAIRLEAMAIRLEAITSRLEAIATRWRPSKEVTFHDFPTFSKG